MTSVRGGGGDVEEKVGGTARLAFAEAGEHRGSLWQPEKNKNDIALSLQRVKKWRTMTLHQVKLHNLVTKNNCIESIPIPAKHFTG